MFDACIRLVAIVIVDAVSLLGGKGSRWGEAGGSCPEEFQNIPQCAL